MKRFYKTVSTALGGHGGYEIFLDERPLRTPAKKTLELPTAALADAIAEEWRAQNDRIDPHAMPLFRLAATAVDRVNGAGGILDEILGFVLHDLVCYRVPHPASLAERQARYWQPLLDKFCARHGVTLDVSETLGGVENAKALPSLRAALETWGGHELVALYGLTQSMGSFVLAKTLADGDVTAQEAFQLAFLEELHQAEAWGMDAEAERRRARIAQDIAHCARYLELLRR